MTRRSIIRAEDGAVTLDWVVLAAGILLVGVPIVALIQDEVQAIVTTMEIEYLTADDVVAPT